MFTSFKRSHAPLVAAAIIAASCTQTQREVSRGDVGSAADRIEQQGTNFASLGRGELISSCYALQTSRKFALFFECYDALEAQIRRDGGRLIGDPPPFFSEDSVTHNKAWTQGVTLGMRADVYFNQGRSELAHADASRVADITRSQKYDMGDISDESLFGPIRRRDQMRALAQLGVIEAEWGDIASARARVQELERVDVSSFSDIDAGLPAEKRGWLAKVYLAMDEPEAAYAAITQKDDASLNSFLSGLSKAFLAVNPASYAISLAATGSFNFDDLFFVFQFEPRFLLHRAELETGRLAEAKAGFSEILNEPRVQGFGTIYWQALYGRGRASEKQGDLAAAIRDYQDAIAVIESQRRSIDTEAGRVSFVGDKQNVYRDLIAILSKQGRDGEAFAYAERGKARALVDILATKSTFGQGASTAALSKFAADEARLVRSARSSGRDISGVRNASASALAATAPELASLVTVPAYDAASLQALVPSGETLIEYYLQDGGLFAFVVTRDSVKFKSLRGERVGALVSRFRREITQPGGAGYQAPGRALYDALIRPLKGDVRTEKVTIVPHGALHYLPWAALPSGAGFLVNDWEIRIAPSASALAFVGGGDRGDGALAVGNPALNDPRLNLPGAEAEATAVAKTLPSSTLLTGRDATETAVRANSVRKDVVHLASHGVFDPTAPLASALLLSADGANDGRLTASEMYDLNLNASLVTLSACETGLGRVQSGDDVLGLTRGLLFSGADSVMASLWLVDDQATSTLMQTLYANRKNGATTSASLRKAQRVMLRSSKRHPFYWAAFQVTGAR